MSNCPYPARLAKGLYHCRHDGELQSEYGPAMTCEVYWTQFHEQGGACAACLRPWRGTPGAARRENDENRLSVDHEHADTTEAMYGADGSFRGLLCQPCNRLLTEGVIALVRRRPDENVIALPGGDVVTASQCAYARNPPAAGLGIWITGRRRPVGTPRERAKAGGAKVSPYRAHLRAVLRPSVFTCESRCPHGGHGGLRRPTRRPTAPPPRAAPRPVTVAVEDPVWWVVLAERLTPRRRCILGCPCVGARS